MSIQILQSYCAMGMS